MARNAATVSGRGGDADRGFALASDSDLAPAAALNQLEQTALQNHEADIERGLATFIVVGTALAAIRDARLYRSYDTFEDYCATRWNLKRQRAYELIGAADVVDKLSEISDTPITVESHAAALAKLPAEERAAAWSDAQEIAKAEGRKVTAGDIERPASKNVESEIVRFSTAKEQTFTTLTAWDALAPKERHALMQTTDLKQANFNKQDNASIEWAQWSWNPVTGCRHDCSYCYARDIADRFYRQGFEPSIYPARLAAPSHVNVPAIATDDIAHKNVFVCSMADLFGRWVPAEWIDAVMQSCADNQQWNFLFLTKFPKRMAEFEIPANCWMGTSVDCQARVKNAQKAFENVNSKIKWLSVEPMLEPLKFDSLEMFNWIVMGGASKSTQTSAWVPPFGWVSDLYQQARAAGCAVYQKDNLGLHDDMRLREYPWQSQPELVLPESLRYLAKKQTRDQRVER
jgi:protein gp37